MGRKIPGRKHHGAKDPEKQQQQRFEKIKMKINNKPDKDDFQEIPKKMQFIMQAKQQLKEQSKQMKQLNQRKEPKNDNDDEDRDLLDSTKHQYKEYNLPGMSRPLKPIPVFKQKPDESKKAFYYRMNMTIKGMLKEKEYEEKFNVQVNRDLEGNVRVEQAEKDELDALAEEKKRKKLSKKGIVIKSKEEKRADRRERERKRRLRKKGKTLQQSQNAANRANDDETDEGRPKDFNSLKDRVQFGEIVHAPPELKLGNKFKIGAEERRPGSKNLLLAGKLAANNGGKKSTANQNKPSMARKAMLEKERIAAVQMYREMKQAKMKR